MVAAAEAGGAVGSPSATEDRSAAGACPPVVRSGDPGVPVVALTALDFVEAEELVRLGLDGFIKKPFEPKELVETLRHVLAQRR